MNRSEIKAVSKYFTSNDRPENDRPIALCIQHLERIIYTRNRIRSKIDVHIIKDKVNYRNCRHCYDQVVSLHIEAGFQDKQKTEKNIIEKCAGYDFYTSLSLFICCILCSCLAEQ